MISWSMLDCKRLSVSSSTIRLTITLASTTSSSILMLAYGYDSYKENSTQLIEIAEKAMEGSSRASEPGRWWVDSFPICAYNGCASLE